MDSIKKNRERTHKLVGVALFTAIVVILQFISMNLRFAAFSITLVLMPVVLGTALYGVWAGAWLGFVFGVTVLLTGDAAPFLAINVSGTIITVLVKGTAAGLIAGLAYKALEKYGQMIATFVAAVLAPIVNTGLFVLGCRLFFFDTIAAEGSNNGYNNTWLYIILFYVGINFIIELVINLALNPVIIRLINIGRKTDKYIGA